MDSLHHKLAQELGIQSQQISAVSSLLEDGNTVPFIARYRKEATGSLSDEHIGNIQKRLGELQEINKRRDAIIHSLEERDLCTTDIKAKLDKADSLSILEDIYLPFKPKRRTRAEIARQKGLEPLAKAIFSPKNSQPINTTPFVNIQKGVKNQTEALDGASDIIAEWISENIILRGRLRKLFAYKSTVRARVVDKERPESQKFADYFDHQETVQKAANHRLLALFRGEECGVLKLQLRPDPQEAQTLVQSHFRHHNSEKKALIDKAAADSYKRLLQPSLENELRAELKKKADTEAISIFTANLKKLLLSAPLGEKSVLALDPGFRTGAKLVCLNKQGRVLEHCTIFPTLSEKQRAESEHTLRTLVTKHKIEAIAIGNGTAGRETESFVRKIYPSGGPLITMVNESGASIYSASPLAREEFPEYDVTIRGAISIGRRLQDPLAELVKIDPKAIGVGQYQHDVNQVALHSALNEVVIQCVNQVGVELNTASYSLLSFVSGIGPTLAKNIVAYRNKEGAFTSRKDLLKVPRLGGKAFEQSAGFLRIARGTNSLDNTGIHPEQYSVVHQMAKDCTLSLEGFIASSESRKNIDLSLYISRERGRITLQDIMAELEQPGRDPREKWSEFSFAKGIEKISDLIPEMIVPGIVTNVTTFGAFVDIGVHQDGLVHISQLSNTFVKDPNQVVQVQQEVQVRVLEVDVARKRIALSMKEVRAK